MSVFNLKKGKLIARSDQIEDELLSVAIIKVCVCVCVCVCVPLCGIEAQQEADGVVPHLLVMPFMMLRSTGRRW